MLWCPGGCARLPGPTSGLVAQSVGPLALSAFRLQGGPEAREQRPHRRAKHAMCCDEDCAVYVFGGWFETRKLNDLHCIQFNPASPQRERKRYAAPWPPGLVLGMRPGMSLVFPVLRRTSALRACGLAVWRWALAPSSALSMWVGCRG